MNGVSEGKASDTTGSTANDHLDGTQGFVGDVGKAVHNAIDNLTNQ